MKRVVSFLLCLLSVSLSFSSNINLSGRVVDESGNPIPLAEVHLKQNNLSAITDINGEYHIGSTPIVTNASKVDGNKIFMSGQSLHFELSNNHSVKITVYSLNGRIVNSIVLDNLSAGVHSVDPFKSIKHIAKGVYVVSLFDGLSHHSFKMLFNNQSPSTVAEKFTHSFSPNLQGEAINEMDTLLVTSKEGHEITSIPLTSLVDTLPTLYVIQRNIAGSVDMSNLAGTEYVPTYFSATLYEKLEGSVEYIKTNPIGFNTAVNEVTGFMYFVFDSKPHEYEVCVNIYDQDSLLMARSTNVAFTTLFGDIQIPTTDASMGLLSYDTEVRDSGSFTIITALASSPVAEDITTEWDLGGTGKFTAGASLVISENDISTLTIGILKIEDSNGRSIVDTIDLYGLVNSKILRKWGPTVVEHKYGISEYTSLNYTFDTLTSLFSAQLLTDYSEDDWEVIGAVGSANFVDFMNVASIVIRYKAKLISEDYQSPLFITLERDTCIQSWTNIKPWGISFMCQLEPSNEYVTDTIPISEFKYRDSKNPDEFINITDEYIPMISHIGSLTQVAGRNKFYNSGGACGWDLTISDLKVLFKN